MPEMKKHGRDRKDKRPIVVDDFIYNDPENSSSGNHAGSDTPDDAVRKLQESRNPESVVSAGSIGSPDSSDVDSSAEEYLGRKDASAQPWVSSSGIILDGKNRQPVDTKGRRPRREHRRLRGFALTAFTVVLILFIAAYIFHRIDDSVPFIGKPEVLISRIVSPVQAFFSRVTDSTVNYIRSWQMSDDLENRYEEAVALNEQLTYKKMLADDVKGKLGMHLDFSEEVRNIENMNPLSCKITGRSDTDYFSTFTIDKGSDDGILEEMPVVSGGSLVGYIDSVDRYRSVVRTVIDSNVSIGVVIQSNSRDQGTLSGTIGIDGTPMCRVYLVEKTELPRPGDQVITSGVGMDFMDGIPIGLITESTRGSRDNTDFIVVKPNVDFSTLEHVVVLRYKTSDITGQSVDYTDVSDKSADGVRPEDSKDSADEEPTDEYNLSDDFVMSEDIEMMDYNEYAGDNALTDDMTSVDVVVDDGEADFDESEGGDTGGDPEET